jgi:hypothetical protein
MNQERRILNLATESKVRIASAALSRLKENMETRRLL